MKSEAYPLLSKRARQILSVYAVASSGLQMAREARHWLDQRTTWTVTVRSGDVLYDDVMGWLLTLAPQSRLRSLTLSLGRSDRVSPDKDAPALLQRRFEGSKAQQIIIDGHKIRVEVGRENAVDSLGESISFRRDATITFTCRSPQAREVLLQAIQGLVDLKRQSNMLYLATKWGDWLRNRELATRSLSSVVLREGLAEDITADLRRFLVLEQKYLDMGLPWHRGYVFHGGPGSGKTSLARALAHEFGMDVYYVPLSDMNSDTNLMHLINGVQPRSMLLLEDIDVVRGATDRDDQHEGVSLSGLLNSLDGVTTPHGLITVMTTNNLDALDPALIRPGRADRVIEIADLDQDQAERLAAKIVGRPVSLPPIEGGMMAAEMLEAAKAHLDAPAEAEEAIVKLVKDG